MNIEEAYQVLEVSSNISDDDLKKKHKELSFKYHPDRGGEVDKLKKINESYQFVKDYREHPEKYQNEQPSFWSGVNFADIFKQGFFNRQDNLDESNVQVSLNLTFKEAILGCSKEISYEHKIKCQDCNGQGGKQIGNSCKECDGFGRMTKKNSGFVVQMNCHKCFGKGVKEEKCIKCSGKRCLKNKTVGSINVPPGVSNGNTLSINNRGNFVGQGMFGDEYSAIWVHLNIQEHKTMKMDGKNILSSIDISLLDAIKGCERDVETIHGNKKIKISPKSKNKEVIEIKNCGVKNTDGKHIVQLNVNYPDDLSKLIEVLDVKSN